MAPTQVIQTGRHALSCAAIPESVGPLVDTIVLAAAIGPPPSWSHGVPITLLPMPGGTLLESLLVSISSVARGTCTVCTTGLSDLIADLPFLASPSAVRLQVRDNPIPQGSAGCIKACESRLGGGPILVVGGSVWLQDDPCRLIERHRSRGNAVTVFCRRPANTHGANGNGRLEPAGVYCCDPAVLGFIRNVGYQDLKEQVLPAVRAAGLRVEAQVFENESFAVTDWPSYLCAIEGALSKSNGRIRDQGLNQIAPHVWCGEGVDVAADARVVGPALIGHGCALAHEALVVGPTMLADGSRVGAGSWLVRVVAPHPMEFPPGTTMTDQLVVSADPCIFWL